MAKETQFLVEGTKVRLRNGDTQIYTIDTLGTNKGVYRISPPAGTGYWVIEDMIELVPPY